MLSLLKHLGRLRQGIIPLRNQPRCFDRLSMTDAFYAEMSYFVMSATSSSLSGFTFEG